MGCCIQCVNLTKRYKAVVAVDNLSLEVQTGEVFGLLGPNGAGKSTTLYMLTGLVRPTGGTISVFGRNLHGRDFLAISRRMGVVLERPVFPDYLSLRDTLRACARLAGRDVTIDRALDLVGLLSVAGRKVGGLSMGMRQRLGLAQAILLEPELLILDEPANGLDPEATHDMLELLHRLADEARTTIVFSSHMLHEVEELCDRVAVMNNGRLVVCDRTDALVSYDQSHVEILVDAPEAAAKRLREQTWVVTADVRPGRIDVVLRDGNVHQLAAFLVGTGYKIAGIIPQRRTLQDYFLKALKP